MPRLKEIGSGRVIVLGDDDRELLLDSAPGPLSPEAVGAIAWSCDPKAAAFPGTQANTHLEGVQLRKGQVLRSIALVVTSAGAAGTDGFVAVYDANLVPQAQSANSPVPFQTTGWVAVALALPYLVPADGLYYLACGFLGGTLPTILNQQGVAAVTGPMPAGLKPIGIHAQVPSAGAGAPNPAVSQGTYANHPLLVAF